MQKFYFIEQGELIETLQRELQGLKQAVECQTKPSPNDWITSKDVPTYLGISRRTWQNYRDKKLIPFSQVGRKIWVKRSDLDAFIESACIGKHSLTSKDVRL